MKIALIYFFLALTALLSGCRTNNSSSTGGTSPVINEKGNAVIITDITGREWDITNAVNKYGMEANQFHFGIGIGAIPSVDNPRVLDQTSPGFPGPDFEVEIFGTDIEEDQRAYSRYELSRHEIFNDEYPSSLYPRAAVGFCPLFDLASVWDRRLEGSVLTFAPSGWTHGEYTGNSLFVLIDKETLSLWFPMEINRKRGLYCIAGEYADNIFLRFNYCTEEPGVNGLKLIPTQNMLPHNNSQ